jgi:hypothetical protein
MTVLTLKRVSMDELPIMIQLMTTTKRDFENRSFKMIAKLISEEFTVDCREFDIEDYYTRALSEDYELESRKFEYGDEYTDRFE